MLAKQVTDTYDTLKNVGSTAASAMGKIGTAASPITEDVQRQMVAEATSVTPNFTVDMNDERLTAVTDQRDQALAKNEATYNGMIADADKLYADQIQSVNDWENIQKNALNEQTDFAIDQIELNKDRAHQDYLKEQSGAYVDWQKQSNQFGAAAEKMASNGMLGTGYSESSQVAMYNQYQNRIAVARESIQRAIVDYDNQIAEARMQNSVALAEIAVQALEKRSELAIEGALYHNQLIENMTNRQDTLTNMYHNMWKDTLDQINTENSMSWDATKFFEDLRFRAEQADLDREHDFKLLDIKNKHELTMQDIEIAHDKAMLKAQQDFDREMFKAKTDAAKTEALAEFNRQKELIKLETDEAIREYKAKANFSNSSKGGGGSGGGIKITGGNKGDGVIATGGGSPLYTKSTTPSATLNTKSVLSLGRGPLNGTTVANMVNNGTAKATIKNGQVYVSKTAPKLPTSKFNAVGQTAPAVKLPTDLFRK